MNAQNWQKLTFAQQLGNIGSEISRCHHWDNQKDMESRDKSIERAIELIDLTLNEHRQLKHLKEITRLREVLADKYSNTKQYDVSYGEIEMFCTSFILREI